MEFADIIENKMEKEGDNDMESGKKEWSIRIVIHILVHG